MLSAITTRIATPIASKRGFANAAIIERWAEIVGSDLAQHAVPLEVKFQRQRNDGATLVLQVASGAAATLLQMKAPVLLERVNAFLGYKAIARIDAQQGPLPRRARTKMKPEPVLNAQEQTDIEQKIKNIVSSDLRVALQRLGSAIARRQKDHVTGSGTEKS
jgi:hypothetical protein